MKRLLLALLFGTCAYAIAFASAATIGTVADPGVGAGTAVISSCDTDGVTTAYGYTSTTAGYNVTSVTVTNINTACNTKKILVTVLKGDGSATASGSGNDTVASGAATVALTNPGIPAASAERVNVVIG